MLEHFDEDLCDWLMTEMAQNRDKKRVARKVCRPFSEMRQSERSQYRQFTCIHELEACEWLGDAGVPIWLHRGTESRREHTCGGA